MHYSEEEYSHYNYFKKLCDGEYSKRELNKFIERLFIIAESYIYYHYRQIRQLDNSNQDTNKEIASEAIAPLFQNSVKGNHFVILEELRNWDPPVQSEKEALFFLHKVIANRVEQHISFILRESDPFFSRLLNTVNHLIRKENLNKINFLGKVYITEPGNSSISRKVINPDEFQELPLKLFFDRKILFKSLFNYIIEEKNYFPAIPLNELIFKLKYIDSSDYLFTNSVDDISERLEVNEIVNSGLFYTQKKLKSSYLDKGKLNEVEYDSFKLALNSLADDLSNGGLNPKLHSYLTPYFKGLSKKEYYQKYHNILEYLLKQLKEKIAEALCFLSFIYSDLSIPFL